MHSPHPICCPGEASAPGGLACRRKGTGQQTASGERPFYPCGTTCFNRTETRCRLMPNLFPMRSRVQPLWRRRFIFALRLAAVSAVFFW